MFASKSNRRVSSIELFWNRHEFARVVVSTSWSCFPDRLIEWNECTISAGWTPA